jgi:hypothetical protein
MSVVGLILSAALLAGDVARADINTTCEEDLDPQVRVILAQPQTWIQQNYSLLSQGVLTSLIGLGGSGRSKDALHHIEQAVALLMYHIGKLELPPGEPSIQKSGLSAEQIESLKKYARDVVSVEGILKTAEPVGGYSLGLSFIGSVSIYRALSEVLGLTSWPQAYRQVGMNSRVPGQTKYFLDKLEKLGKPIIFFLPNGIFDRQTGANVTRAELIWFLENPDRMQNVTFVTGAYDLVTDRMLELEEQIRLESGINTWIEPLITKRLSGIHQSELN